MATNEKSSVDIYFPMAGQGARFGHKFKPFLTVGAETFIEAAARPFRRFASDITRLVFVYLRSQEEQFDVRARLLTMFRGMPVECVLLDAPTRGPAETVGNAVRAIGARGRAMVCDCDHSLDVAPLFAEFAASSFETLLPVWPLEEENLASWSVAKVEAGRVLAIAEKRMPDEPRGTARGVIGCYGFADIAAVAERAYALDAANFSDVIAEQLAHGRVVRAATITNARFFGDPQRLDQALTRGTV